MRLTRDIPRFGMCHGMFHGRLGSSSCMAMSLTEVVVSIAIGTMMFGGVILSYIQSANRAEWSAISFAAQSLAWQRIEQTRAAKWDTQSAPPVDEVVQTNFPTLVELLDIPFIGTNFMYATSQVDVTVISQDPPLKMIVANVVWSFKGRLYTNSAITYRSPDQ